MYSFHIPGIGVYVSVCTCKPVCAHIHTCRCMCECVCNSTKLKYFMLFSLATMKIFPKDKISVSKPHPQGSRGYRVGRYVGHSMESKFWLWLCCLTIQDFQSNRVSSIQLLNKYILFVKKKIRKVLQITKCRKQLKYYFFMELLLKMVPFLEYLKF